MSKEFENIKFEDINIEAYEDIKVEMDYIKKAKMKKALRSKIMKKKKISKKIAIAASAALIIGMSSIVVAKPAWASNIPIIGNLIQKN